MFLAQKYSINFDKSHYENHTAYLQSWAKVLENNPNEIFKAASEAEKAMRYIEERMINIRTNELEVDDKKIDNIENFSSKAVKLNASQMYLATAQKLLKASNNTWQKDFNQTIIEELSKSGKNIFDIKNAVMKHSPVKVTNSELTELAKTLKKSTTLIR